MSGFATIEAELLTEASVMFVFREFLARVTGLATLALGSELVNLSAIFFGGFQTTHSSGLPGVIPKHVGIVQVIDSVKVTGLGHKSGEIGREWGESEEFLVEALIQVLSEGVHLGRRVYFSAIGMSDPLLVPFIKWAVALGEIVHHRSGFEGRFSWDKVSREVVFEGLPGPVINGGCF